VRKGLAVRERSVAQPARAANPAFLPSCSIDISEPEIAIDLGDAIDLIVPPPAARSQQAAPTVPTLNELTIRGFGEQLLLRYVQCFNTGKAACEIIDVIDSIS
jgi:hypothetical protein